MYQKLTSQQIYSGNFRRVNICLSYDVLLFQLAAIKFVFFCSSLFGSSTIFLYVICIHIVAKPDSNGIK